MKSMNTIGIEDHLAAPFFNKTKISIERGDGVRVWDEDGNRYLDFTAGWGVTSIGHASPVIAKALADQAGKIIHNPDSGLTYSPSRAKLLMQLREILPQGLTRVFFTNSGAEAVDAAIKLARKASGRRNVVSAISSFHGRTIAAVSATGQHGHREKHHPLVPNHLYVPYNDISALEGVLKGNDAAAFLVEPVQGEGGVRVPADDYLERVSEICERHGTYLILDEVQTGFFRTGTAFASSGRRIKVDFIAMAKGIAGGFPFGAFAMTEAVSQKLERGDHGGTYCGNPLGCAVASAVIGHLVSNDVGDNVIKIGGSILERLRVLQQRNPGTIADVRGKGLLIGVEFSDPRFAQRVKEECLGHGLIVNLTQGRIIRFFPALTITADEAGEGIAIFENAVKTVLS